MSASVPDDAADLERKARRIPTCGHPERKHRGKDMCEPCYNAWYRAENREELSVKAAARYAANPEPAKIRAAVRNARPEVRAHVAARNATPEGKDRAKARQARYLAKPDVKAHRKAHSAEYRAAPAVKARMAGPENKARESVNAARQRAKRYGVVSDLTFEQVLAALAYYGNTCAYCGVATTGIDHVIPMGSSDHGPNTASNVVPCCWPCNRLKWDLDLDTFVARNPHVAAYLGIEVRPL